MSADLLATIFSSSPNVVSQPNSVDPIMIQNPTLTDEESENLVKLSIGTPTTQVE